MVQPAVATPDGGSSPPVRPQVWDTVRNPPPQLEDVMSILKRPPRGKGFPNKNAVIAAIRSMRRRRSSDPAFPGQSAEDLVRFLVDYGVLHQPGAARGWLLQEDRLNEVQIACANGKPLPYNFVVTNIPGDACGCPRPVKKGVKSGADAAQPNGHSKGAAPKPVQVRRMAYLTQDEQDALTAVELGLRSTTLGEFRLAKHNDPEEFGKSVPGKLFGRYGTFVRFLDRFVAGGILRVVPQTGPDGSYDAYTFAVPMEEIRFFLIDERVSKAVPKFVHDIISQTLSLENIELVNGELVSTTVRRAAIKRLTNRGALAVESVVDAFVPWMCQYRQNNPAEGWGLILQASIGAEVLVCFPGFGPVQFVEDSTFMRRQMIPILAEEKTAPTQTVPSTPPRLITVGDIGEGTGDEVLDQAIATLPAVLEAAKVERARRVEAARIAAEAAAREARRVELQARVAASREIAAARAAEAERISAEAELARQEAERVAAELKAAEAELAAL